MWCDYLTGEKNAQMAHPHGPAETAKYLVLEDGTTKLGQNIAMLMLTVRDEASFDKGEGGDYDRTVRKFAAMWHDEVKVYVGQRGWDVCGVNVRLVICVVLFVGGGRALRIAPWLKREACVLLYVWSVWCILILNCDHYAPPSFFPFFLTSRPPRCFSSSRTPPSPPQVRLCKADGVQRRHGSLYPARLESHHQGRVRRIPQGPHRPRVLRLQRPGQQPGRV